MVAFKFKVNFKNKFYKVRITTVSAYNFSESSQLIITVYIMDGVVGQLHLVTVQFLYMIKVQEPVVNERYNDFFIRLVLLYQRTVDLAELGKE